MAGSHFVHTLLGVVRTLTSVLTQTRQYTSAIQHHAWVVASPVVLIILLLLATPLLTYYWIDAQLNPRPRWGGYCWSQILDPIFVADKQPTNSDSVSDFRRLQNKYGWLDRDELRRSLLWQLNFNKMQRFDFEGPPLFPYIRILAIPRSRSCYHVLPMASPHGRLVRITKLPRGWYGAGPNPDFFSESSLRNVILSLHVGDYSRSLTQARQSAPYAVPKKMEGVLTKAGIPQPPAHAPPHSHPVHYAFENSSLQELAKALQGDWFGLFLKPAKVGYLRNMGAAAPSGLFNPRYEAKDLTRYRESDIPLERVPHSSSPVWFAHDVLHHLTPSEIGDWFDDNPNLDYLFATAVIPPETVWDLPALSPALYNFERSKDVLTYIPEGATGDCYYQPYSARRWLQTKAIVTPRNQSVNCSLMRTTHAHHVFVFSRPALRPQPTRTLDMPDLTIIPRAVHPTASLFERLTSPSLVTTLVNYSTRVSATNTADLYSKVASSQAEVYSHYPASYVAAAANYALYIRFMSFTARLGFFSYLLFFLNRLLKFPIVSLAWLWDSWSTSLRQSRYDVPHIWQVKTTVWAADRGAGLSRGLGMEIMDFYQPPPCPDPLARFALFSAKAGVWLFLKFVGFLLLQVLRGLLPWLRPSIEWFFFFFDISWDHTAVGALLSVLVYYAGLRGPTIPIYNPFPPLYRLAKSTYAIVFFLPSAKTGFRAGFNWLYILTLDYALLVFAFPRFGITWWSLYIKQRGARSLMHLSTLPIGGAVDSEWVTRLDRWLAVVFLLIALVCAASYVHLVRDWHAPPQLDVEHYAEAPPLASPQPSVLPLRPPSLPPTADLAPLVPFLPNPATRPVSPSSVASSGSSFDWGEVQAPPTPLPAAPVDLAVIPADPWHHFRVNPNDFDELGDWRRIINVPAFPAHELNIDNMCVWDSIATVYGMDPERVFAAFYSQLDARDRFLFRTGLVPHDRLQQVLAFFPSSHIVRGATVRGECPRAPGANAGVLPIYHDQYPPLSERRSTSRWPQLVLFLSNNEDGSYHMTLDARRSRDANYEAPGPGAVIGWPSILLRASEIDQILNIPKKVFATVYWRMKGQLRNGLGNSAAVPYPNYFLPAVPVQEQLVRYQPTLQDARDACALASDLKTHPSVLNLHEFDSRDVTHSCDLMAKDFLRSLTAQANGQPHSGLQYGNVNLHLFHGAYGTGKTFSLIPALLAHHARQPFDSGTFMVHTWDHDLREPLKNAIMGALPINLQTSNFMTGYMPCVQPRSGVVVFDDAGKTPAGFLPLFLAMNPGVTDIYLTFDACQAVGVFPNKPAISHSSTPSAKWLSRMSDYYATNVVRTAPAVSALYGMPAAAHIPGRIVHRGRVIVVSKTPPGVPMLVVSPRFAQTQTMGGQSATTFTEAQGHTIHGDVCVDLGGLSATATDAAAWTALTRATGNIYLRMGSIQPSSGLIESGWAQSPILSALLTLSSIQRTAELTAAVDVDGIVKAAVYSHMARSLSPAACNRLGMPAAQPMVGVRPYVAAPIRQAWLDNPAGDAITARTYRSMLSGSTTAPSAAFSRHNATVSHASTSPVADVVRHLTAVPNDSILSATPTEYVMPPDPVLTAAVDPAMIIEEPTDDTGREIALPNWNSTLQHVPDGPPGALHHTRADKLTDLLGQEKRIRVGRHDSRWTHSDEVRLRQLKKGFGKFFDLDAWNSEGFNPALLDWCTQTKLTSWASKRTKRALEASVAKQNLDAPYNAVRLFPKGQYIKKKAKWRANAFPSQTVSDFHLGRIFRDSPWAVYLETKVLQHAFPTTYLHCRASPDDMSKWYKANWQPGIMTGNDYTAWDSGVDHVFLEFDLWLMELCKFPREYIDALRFDRLNTYSHLGYHMPRQESGDRWTWILNTARNAALTGASLDCAKRTPICVSGDDSVTLGAWRRSSHFRPDGWSMKPKREEGEVMEFCGLIFGGDDVTFDPSVVRWRAAFGLQLGRNDEDYWRSIRDTIRECAAKLGPDSRALAVAKHHLHQAVDLFGLSRSLLLPEHDSNPPEQGWLPWFFFV